MPSKDKGLVVFDKNQRRLAWTMLFLTMASAIFLIFLSYFLSFWGPAPLVSPEIAKLALGPGGNFSETILLEIPASAEIDETAFLASPDASRFAYVLKKGEQRQLVVDNNVDPLVDKLTFWSFSPNSKHFAYTVKQNGKERAIIDGVPGPEYDGIFSPRFFTADSAYFIYKARVDGGKDVLVVNGQETRPYERIYEPIVLPEKNILIFFARDGQQLWRGEMPLRPAQVAE